MRRSVLTLKLLDYAPTGAIIAAPTTSLPEYIGGHRNWDYRYCWLRDAGYILDALAEVGYHDEAEQFLEWIVDCTCVDPSSIQVLYRVDGSSDVTEQILGHLEGYRGSKPVRIGNGAYSQYQLDAWGEVVDAAWRQHEHGGLLSEQLCGFIREVIDYVCEHWQAPDAGIWEVRSGPQQFTYSKLMCCVAVDRGIRLSQHCGYEEAVDRWSAVRDEIAEAINTKGWNEEIQSYTQAYESEEMDASLLALVLEGFIPAGDPRMVSTVERVRQELGNGGLIRRYRTEVNDGVGGDEGHFLMCSFWLTQVLAEMGRLDEAKALFDTLAGYVNDVGLYAEEYSADRKIHLGNFPQGFTHVALINAAAVIARVERESSGEG